MSILALAAITAGELPAQVGVVTLVGAVRDSTGLPIAGVEVRVAAGPANPSQLVTPPVQSDSSGDFWIDSLPAGRWVLQFRKSGFELTEVDLAVPEGTGGDVELADVLLLPAAPRPITLAGTIRHAITGRPIADVGLRMGGDLKGFSDRSGHFAETVVVRGNVTLDLAQVGFRPLHVDLWPGRGQDTLKLVISLRPVAIRLSEVVVEGSSAPVAVSSDFERHRKAGFGSFLTPERIQRIATHSAVDMLRWAGVQVGGDTFADGGRFLRIFGVPYMCKDRGPVIFIDGRRWPTESAMAYLETTGPNEIAGVEVYGHAGGMPVEYNGPDAECGVVAVWYRP